MGSIEIKLMSDLCAGNGESSGYGIDTDICADNFGFPFIPARRIMGCLRETAIQLREYGLEEASEENINEIFGNADGKEGKLRIGNAYIPDVESMQKYIVDLKNEKVKRDYLIRQSTEEKIRRVYMNVRGQTRIDEHKKAEKGSLRFVRVLNRYDPITGNPMVFKCDADVSLLEPAQRQLVDYACRALRHIGLARNRGLGNIRVIPHFDTETENQEYVQSRIIKDKSTGKTDMICFSYHVRFDSAISLQEYMEEESQIKARTMIGFFSGVYLKHRKEADDTFKKLFLDGKYF